VRAQRTEEECLLGEVTERDEYVEGEVLGEADVAHIGGQVIRVNDVDLCVAGSGVTVETIRWWLSVPGLLWTTSRRQE